MGNMRIDSSCKGANEANKVIANTCLDAMQITLQALLPNLTGLPDIFKPVHKP